MSSRLVKQAAEEVIRRVEFREKVAYELMLKEAGVFSYLGGGAMRAIGAPMRAVGAIGRSLALRGRAAQGQRGAKMKLEMNRRRRNNTIKDTVTKAKDTAIKVKDKAVTAAKTPEGRGAIGGAVGTLGALGLASAAGAVGGTIFNGNKDDNKKNSTPAATTIKTPKPYTNEPKPYR